MQVTAAVNNLMKSLKKELDSLVLDFSDPAISPSPTVIDGKHTYIHIYIHTYMLEKNIYIVHTNIYACIQKAKVRQYFISQWMTSMQYLVR